MRQVGDQAVAWLEERLGRSLGIQRVGVLVAEMWEMESCCQKRRCSGAPSMVIEMMVRYLYVLREVQAQAHLLVSGLPRYLPFSEVFQSEKGSDRTLTLALHP